MKTRILALTTLTLLMAACDTKTETTTTKTETTTETPAPAAGTDTTATTPDAAATTTPAGGKADTLVIQYASDVPTLDPGTSYDTSSGELIENMYETLVTYKGNSLTELEGLLATEWKEEEGGLKYRFTLRPDVKFHSGNAMTCADAEYTFERNLVTNTSDSGNWFIAESLLGTGANANDDDTITWERIDKAVECDGEALVFTLPKVDPAFVSKLAYSGQSIVDSKHAKEIGEWDGTEKTWKENVGKELNGSPLDKKPSGTGPYMLVSENPTTYVFKAFDGYWGGAPKIKNVIRSVVPEQSSRLQALQAGDADMVETGGREVIEAQLAGKPNITVIDNLPNVSAFALSMNEKIADGSAALGSGKLDGQGIPADFFSDADVRRGFVSAFDYQGFIDQVLLGKGATRNVLLPDTFPGYDKNLAGPEFNLDKATESFKKAWGGKVWENGFTINAVYRAGSTPAQTMMEMFKQNVESINPKFKVNIQEKQWSDILKDAKDGKEAIVSTGWSPDYADPDNFIHTFYHSDGYYQPRANFADAEIDAWIDEARSTTDTAKRAELYSKIAKKAQDEAYYIIQPASIGINATNAAVKGISAESFNPMYGGGWLWKNLTKE
ncbi:ABC transporter substrate-binding protein [Deinococcus lacus]|uniref:ABC transporter substrate-binding protein n=1 Tax=Deinococcus lacus TaxID=392561 RepID=A0ABW1Y986_9DEIO